LVKLKNKQMSKELKKPLFALTVGEYLELNKKVFIEYTSEIVNKTSNEKTEINSNDLIYTDEVLTLTGYKKPTLYSKVSRSEIPVVSRRTPLTFSRKKILKWIKNGRPNQKIIKP